uniref:Putative secreted protein n=1 Tax=Anopheles triannulatus TaxID=58253 RepID=A0A2M4B1M8_9DIPT
MMIHAAPLSLLRISAMKICVCVCRPVDRTNGSPIDALSVNHAKTEKSNSNPKMAYGRNTLPLHVLREKVRKKRTLNQSRQIAHRRDPLSVHIL